MAYRHVKYDHKKNIVHLWTWDKSGARVKKEIPFKPFLMVPSENGKYKSIDGKTLRKVEFKTISDREKYWERNENMQIYNCINVEQQFMLEVFGKVPIDALVKHTLKTYVLDIEVYSPKEFPHAEESAHPINLITIHDNISDKFYTWGTDAYDADTIAEHISDDVSKVPKDRVVYKQCKDETELLRRFVTFWKSNTPDVLVTWNGLKFDVPYIMGRLDKLFGDNKKQQLSPIGQVTAKDTIDPKFQTMYKEYTIAGVSHIDYMNLFRYFARNEVNSFKLDDVAKETLGISKLDYSGSLAQLSGDDWNKYVNYNIQDVNIIVLLDKATNYLEVARYSACAGLCNIEKAMGKLAIVGGVIAKTSMERHDAYIPTNRPPEYADKIEGGYVKEVAAGIYHDVLSYDANSLYPSCIITLNISPETKCGRVYSSNNDTVNFTLKGHGEKAWKTEKFINFLRKNDIALSSAGILFTQKKVGILPEFVDYLYSQRKEAKNEMIKLSNSKDANKVAVKELITQLDTKQYLYKILLNSIYGAFANKYFILFDQDCARSITLTGQTMIKKTEEIVNKMFVEEYGLEEKDRVVAIDTDSNYITFTDLLKKENITVADEYGDLTPEFVEMETNVENYINKNIDEWARNKLNSKDPRFVFKRESVCPTALWLKKKHYIIHTINTETQKMDKIKISGLNVAKSIYSDEVKKLIKDIIDNLMRTPDKAKIMDQYYDSYKKFKKLPLDKIAVKSNVKKFKAYEVLANGFNVVKGTPYHVKAGIYHNKLIDKLDINDKYRKIENGDKIYIVALHKNAYNIPTVAYIDKFPEEFNLEIDQKALFKKTVEKQMERIFNAVGWNIPDVTVKFSVDLDTFFS